MPPWLLRFGPVAGESPEVDTIHQNAHLKIIREHRDKGPAMPLECEFAFAEITYIEDCGRDNDDVISFEVSDLPEGYWVRRN